MFIFIINFYLIKKVIIHQNYSKAIQILAQKKMIFGQLEFYFINFCMDVKIILGKIFKLTISFYN